MTSEIESRPPDQRPLSAGRFVPAERTQRSYDGLLLEVARRRDPGAFAVLFSHFGPRIEAYLRRLGAQAAQAEDLAQDVMLTVWQRAVQFDDERASVGAWIFAIARNRFIDVQRRCGRERSALDRSEVVDATDDETEEGLYLNELERHLCEAMAALPREQTELLRRGYYEDKSQSTLADELKLPLGTIKSRQRLALAKLRRLLVELQ